MDMSAVIDAAAAGSLALPAGLRTDNVVAMGQSYGATTVLQLAGARPSASLLNRFCKDVTNSERNISWVLQCSFLTSADQAGLADPRIKAVVAVSPPMSLLFDQGSGRTMNARALVVSGSRDWVVPSGPEALRPMALEARNAGGGHRLVLAKDGDHFNLRSSYEQGAGPCGGCCSPGPMAPLPPEPPRPPARAPRRCCPPMAGATRSSPWWTSPPACAPCRSGPASRDGAVPDPVAAQGRLP